METNPAAEMKPPAAAIKRDRVLENHGVKAFWQAASETSWPFASIYKLLVLTGARREEVAGVKWSELDLDAGVWLLPGARTKNKRDHRIPLSPQAIDLLDRFGIAAIKAGFGYEDNDHVFSTTGHSAPSGFSKAKKALDAKMKAILGARFKDWRIHDLRRTCATGIENLGIDTRVVETALNHVSGTNAGIVGIYQRSDHRRRLRRRFKSGARSLTSLCRVMRQLRMLFRSPHCDSGTAHGQSSLASLTRAHGIRPTTAPRAYSTVGLNATPSASGEGLIRKWWGDALMCIARLIRTIISVSEIVTASV